MKGMSRLIRYRCRKASCDFLFEGQALITFHLEPINA
jgi:hypothetical protein